MKVLVTGSSGFIAKNLLEHLKQKQEIEVVSLGRDASKAAWEDALANADVIFHLAGVNRPPSENEFKTDNIDLTTFIVDTLEKTGRPYRLIFSSSAQAALVNAYGTSKRLAEEYIEKNVKKGTAIIYRLPGVFGKWCRPNYNSVVATFCHNAANGLKLEVRDPTYELKLVYIDDVVRSFLLHLEKEIKPGSIITAQAAPEHIISLGKLAQTIESFNKSRQTLFLPDVGNAMEKALYSTWLTYLPANNFSYQLELKTDNRGSLFELLKTKHAGQVFISTTLPGITRGNHFHHTKTEKFVVIQGTGLIQFRQVQGDHVIEYKVSGEQPCVVDIPPGYTHNITNTGNDVMITLFWSNEVFDPQKPDTIFEKV